MKLKQFMTNSAIGLAMLAASATPILAASLQQNGGTDVFLPVISAGANANIQQAEAEAARVPIDDFEPIPPDGPSTPTSTPTPTPSGSAGGDYIVVFKASSGENERRLSTQQLANQIATQYGGNISYIYDTVLDGFAATFSGDISQIESLPHVDFVVPNQQGSFETIQMPVDSWGIDRIDQRNRPLSNSYAFEEDLTGVGVHAYVIDSGIRATHTDFGGRVTAGTSIQGGTSNDCQGHGTHVAGTIGGEEYGVAKGVTLHPVKISDGCTTNFTEAEVIAAVEWVTINRQLPAVVNMSLRTRNNAAVEMAIENSINNGIIYVIAAGNANRNACSQTPARVSAALTVGASTDKDKRASFSNFGSCVDLFAPGEDIVSAGIASNTAERTTSGTSMAAPHVAGAAALFLDSNPNASMATVHNFIVNSATGDLLSSIGSGSPNRLLFIDPPAETKCAGLTPTLVGTDGNDDLKGTNGVDIILARGGNDTIKGKWGDDIICGGPGDDNIDSGDGEDTIFGNEGRDTIDGGWKRDTIDGGPGNDNIKGGLNDDTINGGEGDDTIDGDAGNDKIYGNAGDDTLRGSGGKDSLFGGAGNDTLFGHSGKDKLDGGTGTDSCSGGSGSDTVINCE